MFWICNLQVPRTAIALPSAEMSSIIFVVSGIISILCFFTNLASTQSIEVPVSGKDLSVDKVLLFVFTLKFIKGVGDPGTSAYDICNDTEFYRWLLFSMMLRLQRIYIFVCFCF